MSDPDPSGPGGADPPDSVSRSTLLGVTGTLTAFMAWAGVSLVGPALSVDDPGTRWAATLFLGFWALLPGVAAYGLTAPLRTDLDRRGVSRATLRGRVEMPWVDVELVQAAGRASIVLSDGSETIRLQTWAYRDRDALVEWVREQIDTPEPRSRP